MKILPLILFNICLFVLIGCQTTDTVKQFAYTEQQLYADHVFTGDIDKPETPEQIFSLTDNAKEVVRRINIKHKATQDRTKEILKYIFSSADGQRLLYRNTSTFTATETLKNQSANCLSLSILAFSLSQEAGMEAVFQDVKIPEYWVSDSTRSWLNGHVNLRIRHTRLHDNADGFDVLNGDIIVDFEPELKQRFETETIDKKRIIAMFYNNKAAEALSNGDKAQAYAYYKAAIKADGEFAVSWSNLGVLYRSNGLYDLAERVYHRSLILNPTSLNTMANLVVLYRHTDRTALAEAMQKKVDNARKQNPYYYVMLGNESLNQGLYSQAINMFDKSLKLDRKNHEAYFGLAKSYSALNNLTKTTYYLRQAQRSAQFDDDKQRYSRKLTLLGSLAKAH